MKLTFLRINSNFTPRFELDQPRKKIGEEVSKELDNGTIYYQLMEAEGITFVNYGFRGHDQWWSSNGQAISDHFGINVRECSVKEPGDYPDSWFACGILKECIPVPDCLEWANDWGFDCLLPKEGIKFPRGKDYFCSTKLDDKGNLIYPKSDSKIDTSDIIQYGQNIKDQL